MLEIQAHKDCFLVDGLFEWYYISQTLTCDIWIWRGLGDGFFLIGVAQERPLTGTGSLKGRIFSGGTAQIWHRKKKRPHRREQSLTWESGPCRFKHHTPSLYETSSKLPIWYLVVLTCVPSLGCFENQNKLCVCTHVHKKDLVAAWWLMDSQKISFWPPFTERVDLSGDEDSWQSIDMLICK